MREETRRAINTILSSIKSQGLKSGHGLGSVDNATLNSVSLNLIDTQALFEPSHLNRILTNATSGILPLCVERPLNAAVIERVSLDVAQARLKSSALFVMATEKIVTELDTDPELLDRNMKVYGSCEVSYKSRMAISSEQLLFVITPEDLVNEFTAAGFQNVYPVPMKTIPVEALELNMSLINTHNYPGQFFEVPDYENALKSIFADEKLYILLHVTRLPCDFDFRPNPVAEPTSILFNHLFKAHPKGHGQVYYKNYSSSAENQREKDAKALESLGLFTLKKASTPNNNLSLIATINHL